MYRARSDDTWTAARSAYEAGEPAESVCERFDLGRSNFNRRKAAEGWRRADQSDPDPIDLAFDDHDDDLPDMDEADFADFAFRRMTVEARRGRLQAAQGWSRLRDAALRQMMAAEREADRLDAARSRRARRDSADRLDDATRVSRSIQAHAQAVLAAARTDRAAALETTPPPAPELDRLDSPKPRSRADRRRQAALARKRGPP